jgi:hypothetical protein
MLRDAAASGRHAAAARRGVPVVFIYMGLTSAVISANSTYHTKSELESLVAWVSMSG